MSPHAVTPKVYDLTIVGGGPTGLLAAVLARQLSMSVRILDSKPTSLPLGRADALNARTQEYLTVVPLLDKLLPQGLKCNTSSTFAGGAWASRQSHWWTGLTHCEHKNFLMIGQPVVEALLRDELDIAVDYSTTAEAVREIDGVDGSTSTVEILTTAGETITSRYVLAADGAKSALRMVLNIPFTGDKPQMVWAVLDTFIDTTFPTAPEIVTFELDGQARVSWIPRERGMARFYVLLDGEITQERAEESIRAHMAPHTVEFKRTEWFSTFEIKERVAQTFITGSARNIFLAGDAAHVHSVNGGQGLNTGLADAFALVWRLAFALRRPESRSAGLLLGSYDQERREVARGVIDVAAKLVRSTIKTAEEYVGIIEKSAGYITGMGVEYPSTGELVMKSSGFHDFVPGKRCPDMLVCNRPSSTTGALVDRDTLQSSARQRLYSHVRYGKFLVLFLNNSGAGLAGIQSEEYNDFAEFWEIYPENTTVAPTDVNGKHRGSASSKMLWADWLEEGDCMTVVVRPDMYVGYVGNDWKKYFEVVLEDL